MLSDRVLKESTTYLGPAAGNFMERQTKHHLNGLAFGDLERSHLPELAKWIKISAGLLIGKEKAEELGEKILMM
jgi:hypothetical protein